MSFEMILIEHMVGGGIRARCLACYEEQMLFPSPQQGGQAIRSEFVVAHTCRNRQVE